MDTEERLRWLETRIASSLHPRADELKLVFNRDESRATLIEFLSNDDAGRLFVYNKAEDHGGNLKVSLYAPKQVLLLLTWLLLLSLLQGYIREAIL